VAGTKKRRYVYSKLAKHRTNDARTWSGRKAVGQTMQMDGAHLAWTYVVHPVWG
jgi:hypothetical protein